MRPPIADHAAGAGEPAGDPVSRSWTRPSPRPSPGYGKPGTRGAEIAARLGITRQAAQQRWGRSWRPTHFRRVFPRCPRTTVTSQRPPLAGPGPSDRLAGRWARLAGLLVFVSAGKEISRTRTRSMCRCNGRSPLSRHWCRAASRYRRCCSRCTSSCSSSDQSDCCCRVQCGF